MNSPSPASAGTAGTSSPSAAPERLIVFLKSPRPGQVKTRLARDLGNAGAVSAYVEIVDHLLRGISDVRGVVLCFSPDDAHAEISRWLKVGWRATPQGEGDLGRRMERAISQHFELGATKVVVIGSDCPEVSSTDIADAFDALERQDVVLGPAADGGYWLIGLRNKQPGLFREMPWSEPTLLSRTRETSSRLGLRIAELRTLTDIDTVQDWQKWKATAKPGNHPTPKRATRRHATHARELSSRSAMDQPERT